MDTFGKHMAQVEEGMTLLDREELEEITVRLQELRRTGGTLYLFGNGGSAATASHFANDLMKMGKVRAVCVSDMVPVVDAYGNDTGWENMFMGPLTGLMDAKDGVLGISCSGRSPNVITALEWAAGQTDLVMGMTGMMLNTPIHEPKGIVVLHAMVPDIRVQEDLHSIACHAIARALQERGYGE